MDHPAPNTGDISGPGEGPEPELVKIGEAAVMMRVSNMTVYRIIHAGELPAVRIGRTYRIHRADLTEYLAATRLTRPLRRDRDPPP